MVAKKEKGSIASIVFGKNDGTADTPAQLMGVVPIRRYRFPGPGPIDLAIIGPGVGVEVGVGEAVAVEVGLGEAVGVGDGVPPVSMSGSMYRSNWCNVPLGFVPSQFALSAHIA